MFFEFFLTVSITLVLAEYVRRRLRRAVAAVQHTDLSHVALAVLAANAVTEGPAGIAVSATLTALYVVYQTFQDRNPKDIATYTAVYAATAAAKLGLQLVF